MTAAEAIDLILASLVRAIEDRHREEISALVAQIRDREQRIAETEKARDLAKDDRDTAFAKLLAIGYSYTIADGWRQTREPDPDQTP